MYTYDADDERNLDFKKSWIVQIIDKLGWRVMIAAGFGSIAKLNFQFVSLSVVLPMLILNPAN